MAKGSGGGKGSGGKGGRGSGGKGGKGSGGGGTKGGGSNYPSTTGQPSGKGRGNTPKK